jgi:class 3 adenylate cyclase
VDPVEVRVSSSAPRGTGSSPSRSDDLSERTTCSAAGLHTRECELINCKLGGLAVHIAARVASCAEPGEVLVSRTINDLVAGSGIRMADRGTHTLKGIPDSWQLYSAQV